MLTKYGTRLIYISQGNIPTRWAHTFQAIKQAQAFSRLVDDFTFVISRGIGRDASAGVDLAQWYGLSHPFRIRRIPVRWRLDEAYFRNHREPRFDTLATAFAWLKSPDLVFTRSPGAACKCIRLSLPTIFETHAPGDYDMGLLTPYFDHPALRGIVTITPTLVNEYAALGVPEGKILMLPDAVDVERFSAAPNRDAARAALDLPPNAPIALYCGHFYPEKGIGTVIGAARRCPGVQFYLVGGWPDDIDRMKNQCRQIENIHFPGFVTNDMVPTWLAAADVLLLPNSAKYHQAKVTSPMKLFEYMAARKPVIASAIPAFEGVLAHGRNAYLFEPDNPAALGQAIEAILADRHLSEWIAKQAWREVRENTWTNRANNILRFFERSSDG